MNNQQIVLISRPVGVPQSAHFALQTAPVEALAENELLVENIFLSVDPAQRGYVNDENNYAPPVPVGAVMRALAVGRVVESRYAPVAVGEILYGWFGWQEYCVCTASAILRRVDPRHGPVSTGAGLFGINGLTASLALETIGRPQRGETILVTAAAGAVGSFVGQLAKLAGCRTVAVVGSDAKGEQCVSGYGYDAYINYREDFSSRLQQTCPDGVDIFFDNVAGEIADRVMASMRLFGRVIKCGTISVPAWVPPPQGPRIDREILTRRLRVEGFVVFDHAARFDAVVQELASLLAAGKLRYEEDIEAGLARAPYALADVYAGRNHGKKLIQLREP